MARALSLTVVGEGVETEAQACELRRLGCSHAQGNLFSEPVPAGRIASLIRAEARLARAKPELRAHDGARPSRCARKSRCSE